MLLPSPPLLFLLLFSLRDVLDLTTDTDLVDRRDEDFNKEDPVVVENPSVTETATRKVNPKMSNDNEQETCFIIIQFSLQS